MLLCVIEKNETDIDISRLLLLAKTVMSQPKSINVQNYPNVTILDIY